MFIEFDGCGDGEDYESVLRKLAKEHLEGQALTSAKANLNGERHLSVVRTSIKEAVDSKYLYGLIERDVTLFVYEQLHVAPELLPKRKVFARVGH